MRPFLIFVALFLGVVIYLSLRPRSGRPLTTPETIAEMQSRAQIAVTDAKAEFDAELDYSPESVETVELILATVHQQHVEVPISDIELTRHALKWGGYVGEVIKRVRPAEWKPNSKIGGEGSFPIVYEDKNESFPVRWCYKRIVNGEADNVWNKFSLLVLNRDLMDQRDVDFAENHAEQ